MGSRRAHSGRSNADSWSRSHDSSRAQSSSSPLRTDLVSSFDMAQDDPELVDGSSVIVPNDPLGDEARLLAPLALDGDIPRRLDAVVLVLYRGERHPRAD